MDVANRRRLGEDSKRSRRYVRLCVDGDGAGDLFNHYYQNAARGDIVGKLVYDKWADANCKNKFSSPPTICNEESDVDSLVHCA